MAVDLIARLERVRERGAGRWTASCPGPSHAHGDRHPSLSVRQTDDGTWLVRCWAGCSALEIVTALGLRLEDLFPERRIRRIDPSERPRPSAAEALAVLDHEAHVIALIGADVLRHRVLDAATWDRLAAAVRRVGTLRAVCAPARFQS